MSNLDRLSENHLLWSRDVQEPASGLTRTGVVALREKEGYRYYGLTESGRAFANKLRYEQVKGEKQGVLTRQVDKIS